MADRRGRSPSPRRRARAQKAPENEEESFVNTRQLEALGRTVQATASQLISSNFSGNDSGHHDSYHSALGHMHRSLQRPAIQRSVFNLAKANPRELIRSHFNSAEIEHRAITYIPDDLLRNVKETSSPFSLFEGFQASLPDDDSPTVEKRRKHGKHGSKGQKLLDAPEEEQGPPQLAKLKKLKERSDHKLQMMGIRKTMCSSEIKEIDTKISNLNTMRKVVLDRLAGLEQEEHDLEQEVGDLAEKLEVMQEEFDDAVALESQTPVPGETTTKDAEAGEESAAGMDASFMSESVYGKLPKTEGSETPKAKRKKAPRTPRKVSMPVLHEYMEPGSQIREIPAHNDMITALDFDSPFGTMVTAALDDTVRVWDLSAGRCMGMLEGHLSSVRCLQVEDNWVATGSMDASIKLWDLSQAEYIPPPPSASSKTVTDENEESATGEHLFGPIKEEEPLEHTPAHGNAMQDCHVVSLSAHIGEVTALNFRGNTLVSGSADKTLRQWDLETGRCVQTLDVLWAAAQPTNTATAGSGAGSGDSWWRPAAGRVPAAEADFVGALQVFETALACGTADGMVRLWDLRSGMVHRSLVGHTGPITALQFDDVYLVTGSQDRSIRIWDLRTGGIHDAFAYDQPVTSMTFDARRIVSATSEDVVKVYDKAEGRQWDCGPGVNIEEGSPRAAAIERVKIKDGYMIEGRKDGVVGVWSC